MNSLSWMIYIADVTDNLDWVFSTLFLVSIIAGIVCIAFGIGMKDEHSDPSPDDWKMWRRAVTWTVIAFFGATIIGSVIPSKETIYAIAASEMGERALQTPTAGKAFKALDAWLDRQIAGEPAETEAKK